MIDQRHRQYILAGNYELLDQLYRERDSAIEHAKRCQTELHNAQLQRDHWQKEYSNLLRATHD